MISKTCSLPGMLTTAALILAVPLALFWSRGLEGQSVASLIVLVAGAAVALVVTLALVAGFCFRGKASQEIVPADLKLGLNELSEAILLLDYNGVIVFCNRAFLQVSGYQWSELNGRKVKELNWSWIEVDSEDQSEIPWLQAVKSGHGRTGRMAGWPAGAERVFVMNSAPVAADNERPRGALISLTDTTRLHQKQTEMASILSTVRESSRQIRHQQAEIDELALRDPLTGCFHRRYGTESLSRLWRETAPDGEELACLLVDVDHLRVLAEEHGQPCADRVLQEIAAVLLRFVGPREILSRYDGDEFLILLPGTDAMVAVRRAEALRKEISRMQGVEDVTCTVSIGMACRSDGSRSPQELLSRAASRLLQAKEEGRNRVCWVAFRPSAEVHPVLPGGRSPEACRTIPYAAVAALISALAYRDQSTAAHSRRVADLCVALGQRLMSQSSCYVLEMSALLHDIGKIGVPDALLRKAAPLTDEEWSVMHTHDEIGVEIVRTAFSNPELTAIVEHYTRRFDDVANQEPLPLGARILAVADAYDSMTTAQIYRAAMTPEEAVAELHRCSGSQFDPEIVSHFAEVILLRNNEPTTPAPMPREAALAIGLELERLSAAVDLQDLDALKKVASHLSHATAQLGAPEIAVRAMELELALKTESDRVGILQSANELLNHCRATQLSYSTSPPSHFQTTCVADSAPAMGKVSPTAMFS